MIKFITNHFYLLITIIISFIYSFSLRLFCSFPLLYKKDNNYNMWITLLIIWGLNCVSINSQINCHYTCLTCTGSQYYQCTTCNSNRGSLNSNAPISGMCYCINETDEDDSGQCTGSNSFNYNNKAIISVFIGISILLALIIALITGTRYYLIKIIEDVQELSLLVFLNLYFPQQFDVYLTHLYRFNISSYTFESLTSGSLFSF